MARQKGSANLSASLEVLAGAPLDARTKVPLKTDLTTAANWPYFYEGLKVYVTEEKKYYTLIGDDPTVLTNWQEDGTGSGSTGELGKDITAVIDVGGIETGTEFLEGTPYDDMWDALINPVLYPTLTAPSATLTATGDKLLEAGSEIEATITATFDRGSISPAYGTSGYRSGEATEYSLNSGTGQASGTWTETVTALNNEFVATVSYGAGEQPKDSKGNDYSDPLAAGSVTTDTITYEFVDALWANTAAIGTIAKLALVSKTEKQKDFSFPPQTVTNPEVFDIPASWTVSAVQVKNDLSGAWDDGSEQFTITNTAHDNAAGTSVAYKRYTFNMGYATGARQVRVKWN